MWYFQNQFHVSLTRNRENGSPVVDTRRPTGLGGGVYNCWLSARHLLVRTCPLWTGASCFKSLLTGLFSLSQVKRDSFWNHCFGKTILSFVKSETFMTKETTLEVAFFGRHKGSQQVSRVIIIPFRQLQMLKKKKKKITHLDSLAVTQVFSRSAVWLAADTSLNRWATRADLPGPTFDARPLTLKKAIKHLLIFNCLNSRKVKDNLKMKTDLVNLFDSEMHEGHMTATMRTMSFWKRSLLKAPFRYAPILIL